MTCQWYIVHAYSNFEHKVADEIIDLKKEDGLATAIEEVFVPVEEVAQLKRGKKITNRKRFFPGYVLVKMDMTDRAHNGG